ncbi:MAG: hypothetical protein R3F17_12635 [Planctomycetota bacterium]
MVQLPHLGRILFGYDPALVLLGLAGFAAFLRNAKARPLALFTLVWAAYFMTNVNDHVRYLLPVALGLAAGAGFLGEALWRHRAGRAVMALAVLVSLVQVARLDLLLNRPDTRADLRQALSTLPPDSDTALDLFAGELPLDAVSLERVASLRELYSREAMRLERLRAAVERDPGVRALPLENVVRLLPREHATSLVPKFKAQWGADLAGLMKDLGLSHIALVDDRPGDPRSELLLDDAPADSNDLSQQGPPWKQPPLKLRALTLPAPMLEITPGSSARAQLPLAMDFPLIDLWKVDRPGPQIRLYVLP